MILKGHLILTLPDFARHFDFAEFRANRRCFARDMHPDRVWYWAPAQIDAYNDVAAWIEADEHADRDLRARGIAALEMLIGRSLSADELACGSDSVDTSAPIIRLTPGASLKLPHDPTLRPDKPELTIHKIEVTGTHGAAATVTLEGRRISVLPSEFVYVTACGGSFLEFLPVSLDNPAYSLTLLSEDGRYSADLRVRALLSGMETRLHDVISFAVTDDGYIYIDSSGRPIIMSQALSAFKFLLHHDAPALCVKADGPLAAVLYRDGELRRSDGYKASGILRYFFL